MPLYMDVHEITGATAADLAHAHTADLEAQGRHGVECLKYWFNESCGKAFCLFDAPSAEAANSVHREAHGMLAEKIIEVDPEVAEGLLGGGTVNSGGAVLLPGTTDQRDSGVRSILFTDIVGSTELTQRLGDEAAMGIIEAHDAIVRAALAATGGREVKHTGDGMMASFVSAAAAVRCACQIQRALMEQKDARAGSQFSVRIGIAAGEPVEQRNDLFGSTVQLAARLCSEAKPGQILVSNVIGELCIGKVMRFSDAGEMKLKGFEAPVRTLAVELA